MNMRTCSNVFIGLLMVLAIAASVAGAQTLEVSAWYAEPRYTHLTTALREAMEAQLPGVSANFRTKPNVDALLTMVAAGAEPDVIAVHHSDNFPPMMAVGGLLNIGPYIERLHPELRQQVPPELFEPFEKDGGVYAIPAIAELNNTYVNLTMLQEAGLATTSDNIWNWNWDDLLSMARRLTQDTNADSNTESYGTAMREYEQEIGPFIYANGGSYMNAQVNGTEVTIDSPETIEALEFIRALIYDYEVAVPGWQRSRWDSGNLAFFFTGSWNIGTYQRSVGDNFEWDYIPYPRSPNTGERASRLSVIGFAVSKNTDYPEEAARFAQLAASVMAQEAFLEAGLSPVPARLDLFDSPFMPSPEQMPRSAGRTIRETLAEGEAIAETVYPVHEMQTISIEYIGSVVNEGVSPQIAMSEAARLMRVHLED